MRDILRFLRRNSFYAVAFIGLSILDGYLTRVALSLGGKELNPLFGYLFWRIGFSSAMVIKGLLVAFLISLSALTKRVGILKVCCVALLFIDVLNMWLIS